MSLKVARLIQGVYEEHHIDFSTINLDEKTVQEKTNYLINSLNDSGLKYLIPVDQHKHFISKLETLRTFFILYDDVLNKKIEIPALEETDKLVQTAFDISDDILTSISIIASQGLLYQQRISAGMEYFKRGEMPPTNLDEQTKG